LMIVAAVVHFVYHWPWVVMMARRIAGGMRAQGSRMSLGAKVNVTVDILLASSFLVSAISGVVFLFSPGGGFQGGTNTAWDFTFLWGRTTWDLIHTWSGVVMIIAAVLHFVIHWRWVLKVTRRFFLSIVPKIGQEPQVETNAV
jgi:multisubunit Na+/H+ antiporter MnhB subunit